jgi:hypothetical protein
LNDPQLVYTAGLKSSGIMEDTAVVVREDEFILDVMHATLQVGSSRSVITNNLATRITRSYFYRRVELNLAG